MAHSIDLISKVGESLVGIRTFKAYSTIHFEKNEYYLGEEARFRIDCDNSACKYNVKSFKFKLLRTYEGHESHGNATTVGGNYIYAKKEPGLAKGHMMENRAFTLKIPTLDQFHPLYLQGLKNKLDPDLHPIIQEFTPSVNGKLIKINYLMKVFVKHDPWNEFGEGKVVCLPIKIL